MNVRRRASPLVVFGLVAVVAGLAALLLPTKGRPAPDVSFTLLDGSTVQLTQLRGHPVLISFWATSCAPCVEEIPDLTRLYRDLGGKGLSLIAVAMPYDPPLQVQTFVRQHDMPYIVALDVSGTAMRAFADVSVVPTAYLIDPSGTIVLKHVGKLDIERVRRLTTPFLPSTKTS